MNWKSFLLGVAVGAVSCYATNKYLMEQSYISAEKVLENAKKQFKENGPINGSWIHMKVEPFEKNLLSYQVYKGGISRKTNDGGEQYEFIADAKTGTLLEIYSI
ncbi:PepSY domain-containing protein [Bacillus sp. CGMCC 1.16607]|uniref:PepSY domain-containing protein n=1 Tax=Bacillus sp. CGMCC 1.16607 TaxID=3351842 RepID=UPI0036377E43